MDNDLQLAAELGKTLLERNKELEALIKQQQVILEDQTQEIELEALINRQQIIIDDHNLEIEYLTKQNGALREVNDSRLRVYEQLEVSIQDLERANHRLVLENSAEKKHVKTLNSTIEALEVKCEELQSTIDDLELQVDLLKRKNHKSNDSASTGTKDTIKLKRVEESGDDEIVSPDSSVHIEKTSNGTKSSSSPVPSNATASTNSFLSRELLPVHHSSVLDDQWESENVGMEHMSQLMTQLSKMRVQCSKDERRVMELEEQLATVIQQNQSLENQVVQLAHGVGREDQNMKSMHEELTTLDEVRQGQMCSRCLRSLDTSSEILEDDDASLLDDLMATSQHRSSFTMDVQEHNQSSPISTKQAANANPYKDLVQKYEALVEVHRKPLKNNAPSLQEEMQMLSGEFNPPSTKDTDEESGHGDSLAAEKKHKKTRKTFSSPTDFSEAETSSSGFSDETSNKGTQTEGRIGSFLFTIADGDDCKFSIYDDANPIDSRFRDRPEYRDVFREIFQVLKNADQKKVEAVELPVQNDNTVKINHKVPPVPQQEFLDDDSQSVVSSSMSELSTSLMEPTTVIENIVQAQNQPIPENKAPERILRPLVRQPLEYLSVEVRKRSSSRRKNKNTERSDSPATHIIGSPTINFTSRPNSGRKRREQNKNASPEVAEQNVWSGNTLQFWNSNRSIASPTPSQSSAAKYEFRPSTASKDLHKLKKLDLSYAEVLRNADHTKRGLNGQRRK